MGYLERVAIIILFVILIVIASVQGYLGYEQQEYFKTEIGAGEAAYTKLQEEHSQAVEYIEQLEYELEMMR